MFFEKYKDAISGYESFWDRTNKRPIINISYRMNEKISYRDPKSLEEKWFDAEYKYNLYKHKLENTGYVAEGIPLLFANYGPGCLAAALGGDFELAKNTVWFERGQLVKDWENPPEIEFDEESPLWRRLKAEQTRYATDPDVHFSVTDIGGVLDVVASLRGTENLLYDIYDYPEQIKEFSARVRIEWDKAFKQQIKAVNVNGQPYNTWMNIPSSKPWYPLQCDFCYMISPDQFEEFVLPDLLAQVESMERSIYHLDGEGEIRHLDMLLDIPGLNGIQWTAGAGKAPLYDEKWFDLYRRIQDKNKNLVLLGGISERNMVAAERLVKSIDSKGVLFSVDASSREKAEQIVELVEKWSE